MRHDRDRAGRVLRALLADRAEQQAAEAAEAARADYEQRRVASLVHEHGCGVALLGRRLALETGLEPPRLRERILAGALRTRL